MREYSAVSPRFWTGETGRKLRTGEHAKEAVIVATYLMTSPHANMLGLYYLPKHFIAHETPNTIDDTLKGLQRCIQEGFCSYDDATECVFVHEMASWQVDEKLKPNDKRVAGIQKQFELLPKTALLRDFFLRYAAVFHIMNTRGIEGASMPGTGTGARTGPGTGEEEGLRLEGGTADVVLTLPYLGGELPVTKSDVELWKDCYPHLHDVMQSLRNLKAYLHNRDNQSAKASTLKGRITTWLKSDNDRDAKKYGPRAGRRDYHDTGGLNRAGGAK